MILFNLVNTTLNVIIANFESHVLFILLTFPLKRGTMQRAILHAPKTDRSYSLIYRTGTKNKKKMKI